MRVYNNLGDNIMFEIPENYPFSNITLYDVEQPLIDIKSTIFQTIKKIPNDGYNILVYCHPRRINKPDDHFMYEYIDREINKDDNFNIYTIDVNKDGEMFPDILGDGFGDSFINRYSNNPVFDIVFLPDCGGLWFDLQNNENSSFDEIIDLINKMLGLVKPGGKLLLSKFIKEGLYDEILNIIPNAEDISIPEKGKVIKITKN